MKNIHIVWTSHLKDKDSKEQFTKSVIHTLTHDKVVKRLKEILELKSKGLDAYTKDPKEFDSPSWAYKRAYVDGQYSVLETILKILDVPGDTYETRSQKEMTK